MGPFMNNYYDYYSQREIWASCCKKETMPKSFQPSIRVCQWAGKKSGILTSLSLSVAYAWRLVLHVEKSEAKEEEEEVED